MASRSLSCPRCGGSMEQGYIVDTGYGSYGIPKWIDGEPETSIWTGIKLKGKSQLPVTTYRCRSCGFLESYASP